MGSSSDNGHNSHTDHCLPHNMVDMLLYASGRIRAPGAHGTVQEETPQRYTTEARVPFQQNRRTEKEI